MAAQTRGLGLYWQTLDFLKVQSKVGTTLNIKNMVGINTDKNHLAHYRVGSRAQAGDEFSNPRWYDKVDRRLSDALMGRCWKWGKYPFVMWKVIRKLWQLVQPPRKDTFAYGNWHGNDTAWRMAVDLNRILLTADAKGQLHAFPVRRYFSLVDGVVGGQGDGPLHPDAFPSHVIIAGFNPLAVDWTATMLMGLDPSHIPLNANAVGQMREWVPDFQPARIAVHSNLQHYADVLNNDQPVFRFATAPGWRGKIERYTIESGCDAPVGQRDPILQ